MECRGLIELATGVVALGLVGGVASAELMVFDNTGWGFAWNRSSNYPGPGGQRGDGLDITLPATQSGEPSLRTVLMAGSQPATSSQTTFTHITAEIGLGVQMARDGAPFMAPGPFGPTTAIGARTYQVGQSVGPAATWGVSSTVAYYSFATGEVRVLGDEAVVGLRVDMNGQWHYGWIWLQWDPVTPVGNVLQYRPTMWAYETEANTPALVTIPAPGAAALLGFSALAGARRRR